MVRDQRPEVPRARRTGEPRRGEPDVRSGGASPGRCTTTSAATPTARTRWSSCREREPIRAAYRDRDARIAQLDEHGLDVVLAVPDARHDLRGAARATTRSRSCATFRAFNRWLDRGLGVRLPGPHLRRALHHPRRSRLGGRGAPSGPRPRRPTARDAADRAPTTATGRKHPFDPTFDPFWQLASTRPGITRRAPRRRQRSLVERLRRGRLRAPRSRAAWRPSIKFFNIEHGRSTTGCCR